MLRNAKTHPQRLGLLGGGQLARMLALAAHPLGVPVRVLTALAADPAAQVVGDTQLGSLEDEADLKRFALSVDALTFESEFVNIEKLRRSLPKDTYVFPHLDAIEAIQDRLTQKRLIEKFKLPTSPWIEVNDRGDLKLAKEKFPKGFVLKQRRFGYDGYGTFVFKDGKGDESALNRSPHGFIAEEFIPFKRELATSVVRSRSGEHIELPFVESVQVNSRCFSVQGPIRTPKGKSLHAQLLKMMNEIDYVGILACELFDTGKVLLVNELAPRVHNSAHYSQNALSCSQFEYHVRAGLDLPLPKLQLIKPGFAMVNLLGEGNKDVRLDRSPAGALHWYGKSENKPGRKLGHINVLGSTGSKALIAALKWRKDFKL